MLLTFGSKLSFENWTRYSIFGYREKVTSEAVHKFNLKIDLIEAYTIGRSYRQYYLYLALQHQTSAPVCSTLAGAIDTPTAPNYNSNDKRNKPAASHLAVAEKCNP